MIFSSLILIHTLQNKEKLSPDVSSLDFLFRKDTEEIEMKKSKMMLGRLVLDGWQFLFSPISLTTEKLLKLMSYDLIRCPFQRTKKAKYHTITI